MSDTPENGPPQDSTAQDGSAQDSPPQDVTIPVRGTAQNGPPQGGSAQDDSSLSAEAQALTRSCLQVRFKILNEHEAEVFSVGGGWGGCEFRQAHAERVEGANDRTARNPGQSRIVWACTDKKAREHVTHQGVTVFGARVVGELDLRFGDFPYQFRLMFCHILEPISLEDAKLGLLRLSGSLLKKGLNADRITVGGSVYLDEGFQAKGEVRLPGARIGGQLGCRNGTFVNGGKTALHADGITVDGDVFLGDGFQAKGEVRLLGAKVGGQLSCRKGTFENDGNDAFSADRITVEGSVFLKDGFQAMGEVRLLGAKIGGNLECDKGTFENEGKNALSADGITVDGDVFLRDGFLARGEVRLPGAKVGGDLYCENAAFINGMGHALCVQGATIQGNVLLRGDAKIQGEVDFTNTTITGGLQLRHSNPTQSAVRLEHAKCGTFWDDQTSWPSFGNLHLDGFTYDRIDYRAPLDPKDRIDWLSRMPDHGPKLICFPQSGSRISLLKETLRSRRKRKGLRINPKRHEDAVFPSFYPLVLTPTVFRRIQNWKINKVFFPQPYEHLAKVYRDMGHEDAAREILIAKNDARRERAELTRTKRFWLLLIELVSSYGYRPFRSLIPMAVVVAVMAVLAYAGFGEGDILPSQLEQAGPMLADPMNAGFLQKALLSLGYSLDGFIPLVDLGYVSHYAPTLATTFGMFLSVWLWLHILLGWVLTTLFVLSLAGLVKQ